MARPQRVLPAVAFVTPLLGLSALTAFAQDAAPPPVSPTIRVSATEVSLDLVVRDKKGHQVKNLKQGDLEIYEDGVRQQVLSFRMAQARQEKRRQEGPSKPEFAAATSLPLRELNTICIVFHNIDPVTRPHAVEVVKEFIRSNLPPESYIGIFNLNEKLVPVHEFTRNRDELLASTLSGAPMNFNKASVALLTASPNIVTLNVQVNMATHSASVTEDMTGGEVNTSVIMGAEVSNSSGANRVRGDMVREQADFANITGMHETDRIATLIKQVGTLPGRKTVLLVSTGLTMTGDPEIFQKLVTDANSHGITFYALDTNEMGGYDTAQGGRLALGQVASVSQQQGKTNPSASVMRQNSHQGDDTISAVRTSDSQSSMRALAEGTGGFLIANTNDFRKSFQQVADDLVTHYEVIYSPTPARFDGRLHKIEVKVARSDWLVESRTGYFAMPDLKDSAPMTPAEFTAMAVLNTEPRPHSFDFHFTTYHFQKDGANTNTALAFELPSAKLGDTLDRASNTHKFQLSLLALVRDAKGEVVDKFSLEKPYYIPDAKLAAVRADQLTYTHVLDLPPGRYTVDAAVLDREGAQATSETGNFEIPAPTRGLAISSLAMVEHLDPADATPDPGDPFTFQGKHVVPMVEPAASTATKRWIYFVVYQDKANPEKPKIRIQFKNGGHVVADQTSALPAADKNGAIAMFVAAPVRPGACELEITAVQGSASAAERLAYTGTAQ